MMREAFSLFDKDRDSRLKLVEFGSLLRYIGQNPSMAELLDLGNEIGKPGPKPGEKLIELQDFLNWVGSKSTSSDNLDDVIAAFEVFDKDGKGNVTVTELRHVLCNLGERLADDDVSMMLKQANIPDTGQVNYRSFVQAMASRE
jgi:calmodulin